MVDIRHKQEMTRQRIHLKEQNNKELRIKQELNDLKREREQMMQNKREPTLSSNAFLTAAEMAGDYGG